MLAALEKNGYAVMSRVFSGDEIREILGQWERTTESRAAEQSILLADKRVPFAARNLIRTWPRVVEVAKNSSIGTLLANFLGDHAGVVRALFFDKPPGASWALPWHKDYMIAVKEHGKENIFTNPGMAAGIPQVKAPKELLEKMLTVRVHLDDMKDDNGPLRVLPGSHVNYTMTEDEQVEPVTIHCNAGDVLLMRPLLTHASGRSKQGAGHRRILHLECAPMPFLQDGYEWHDFVPLNAT